MIKSSDDSKIMGLPSEEYNAKASRWAKNVIGWWLIAGLIYNIADRNLFSIATVLLFIPGTILIMFVCIPLFLTSILKLRSVSSLKVGNNDWLGAQKPDSNFKLIATMSFWTVWSLIAFLVPIVLAVLSMHLLAK